MNLPDRVRRIFDTPTIGLLKSAAVKPLDRRAIKPGAIESK